jgi:BirA family biotin operon repressor/biotin-[acetyl-CoA-carboxylase] ligase
VTSKRPSAPPSGYRHIALDEVGSTNAYALLRAREGDPGNVWITAVRQAAGKGRRGRQWVSEPGNLYASLLLIDPAPLSKAVTLPLAAALGAYRALRPYFSMYPQALAIKWPNDLLADGRKICGILLESEALADGRIAIVIGCGVNCTTHPQNPLYPATDLAECGISAGAGEVFPALAAEMADVLAEWRGGDGFAGIREAWLLAAGGKGGPVTVRWQDRETTGVFEDIDQDGYLLLNVGGKRQRISAGDLFFANDTVGRGRADGR